MSQKEEFSESMEITVRREVTSSLQWLMERVNNTKLPEEVKRSIRSQLEWLAQKFHNFVDAGTVEFVNSQMCKVCALIDSVTTASTSREQPNIKALGDTDQPTTVPNQSPGRCVTKQQHEACTANRGECLKPSEIPHVPDDPFPDGSHDVLHQSNDHFNGENAKAAWFKPLQDSPAPITYPSEDPTYGAEEIIRRQNHKRPQYDYRALVPLQPGDHPDVQLNVPNLSVGRIDFEIDHIAARVALEADVRDVVHIFAGVDARIGRVKLTIEDVQVTAQLTARLDNVRKVLERGLDTVDAAARPSLLGIKL